MTIVDDPVAASAPPTPAPRRRRRIRNNEWSTFHRVSLAIVLILMAVTLYPIIRVVGKAASRDAISDLVHYDGLGEIIFNTVLVVGCSAVLALLIGGLLAWANERTDARMGVVTDTLPFLPFLIPPMAGAIGWVLLLAPVGGYANSVMRWLLGHVGVHLERGPLDIYSRYGLVIVYTIYLIPYVFLLISAGIRNLDPQLEEQSRISGVGPVKTFFKVVLPGLSSSIASAGLMVIWTGFAMFAVPQAIATPAKIPILSVETVNVITFEFPPNIGLGAMLSLVTMVFIGIAWYGQAVVRSRSRYAVVGGRSSRAATRASLGWAKVPVRIVIVLFIIVVTVLPALALLTVSLNGFWSQHVRWSRLSLDSFRSTILENSATSDAILNSLRIGILTATVAALLAALASVLIVHRRSRVMRLLDGALKLPVVVGPLIISIGVILSYAGQPVALGGTLAILVLTYLVLLVPQGTTSTDAAASQVGRELAEASRISGAKDLRTFLRIYLPIMLPAVAIAWALTFVRVLGDLEISSMLAGTTNATIGYQTMMLYNEGSYADVASLTLVVLLTSAIVVSTVFSLARRFSRWNLVAASTVPGISEK